MRYEHIELDISTRACAALFQMLDKAMADIPVMLEDAELTNLRNNLAARLQRHDIDPHCPLNQAEDWLAT